MKKLFSLFTVLLLFCCSYNTYSQVSTTYTFSQSAGVYTEIVGDTVVAFATGTGTSTAQSLDDITYGPNALPFSYTFNGVSYTSFYITSNGFITFGATAPSGTLYTPISTASIGAVGVGAGYARDNWGVRGITATTTSTSTTLTGVATAQFVGLEVGRVITGSNIPAGATITALNPGGGTIDISAGATASGTITCLVATGSIVRGTTGAVGSRIHTIQFRNFEPWSTSANSNCFNFQIKLYENSNKIEVVYGNATNSVSTTGQVGLRGVLNSDFNNRSTTTDWTATTAGGTNSATCTMSSTVLPPSGRTFTWSPPANLPNDVGVTALISPNTTPGSLNPVATVKNFGTNNQLVPFNVTCTINPGGYSSTVQDTVSAGLSNNVTFANVNLPIGTYNVVVYTSLGSDQDRTNDTLKKTVTLIDPNYGNDSGYFYANNLATTRPSYPRYGWKDTTGSKSIMVNGVSTGFATLVGSLDDGYYKLSLANILIACGQDPTDRHIKYNGVCYDSIFPGTNGIVGMTEQYGATSLSAFNIDGLNVAKNALLPFWHDFNLGTLTFNLTNRLSVRAKGDQLIITYSKVAAFSPANEYASFQVIVELVTGCASANSNFRYTYADTTNGMSSDSLVNDYLTSNNAAPPAATNFRNYVVGWSQNGGPIPYAAYCTSLNSLAGPNNLFMKRSIYNTTTKKGLTVEFGPNQNKLDMHNNHVLGISLALEGLQNNGDGPRVRDTVQIVLRDGSGPPYKIMQKQSVYLDSVYTTYAFGRKYVELSMLKKETKYYLQVMHRNSVTTWSVLDSTKQLDTILYNFTTNVCKAYACNQAIVSQFGASVNVASFFTGNVSGDECVDASDILAIYNDVQVTLEGPYLITDLNWDAIVDASDILLCYNNIPNVVCEQAPPGAVSPVMIDPVPVEIKAPVFSIPDANSVTKDQYFKSLEEQKKQSK